MSYGCRLFCEALLFSWLHDRPRFNPSQHLLVPGEKLAEPWADIGLLFLGHRFECRRAEMCVPRAGPPFSRSSKRVLKLTAGAPPGSESEGAANPGACGAHQPSFLASEPTAATHHS